MMLIRYRPDEGPPIEFDFVPGKLTSVDAEAVELVGGEAWGTFEEFGALFFRGSARARRAVLWLHLRTANPRLKFADVRLRPEQIDVDYSAIERERILEVMLADPDLDDEQRDNLRTIIGDSLVSETETALEEAGVTTDRGLPKDHPSFFGGDGSTLPPPG
jgi:hypothetical protein